MNALAIVPKTFDEVQSMATVLAQSDLLPLALRKKPADVAMTIMTGHELGLSPMASIRMIHIIEGKPSLSADAMVAIVLSSGLAEYFRPVHSDDKKCTYETVRRGDGTVQQVTWTIEMAKAAGLYPTKDNWRLHTRQMLAARAKSELARAVYPDVMAGCFDPDEIAPRSATAPVRAPVVVPDAIDAEIVPSSVPEELEHDIEHAATTADLEALVPRLSALGGPALDLARKLYSQRKTQLKAA